MFFKGKPLRDLIEVLEAKRSNVVDDMLNEPELTIEKLRNHLGRYNALGVGIYREKQARGLVGTPHLPVSEHYIQDTTLNHKHSTPYN